MGTENEEREPGEAPSHRDLLNKLVPWTVAACVIAAFAWRLLVHIGADLKTTVGVTVALFGVIGLAPWFKFIEKPFVASEFRRPRSFAWTVVFVAVLIVVVVVPFPPWTHGSDIATGTSETSGLPATSSTAPPLGCEESVPIPDADWGPDRPLAPWLESPVPSFNNAIGPRVGDDTRANLVSAREALEDTPQPDGGYRQQVPVESGKVYRVRFFAYNNARRQPDTAINNARGYVHLPTCPSTDVRLVGGMTGAGAIPESVWSTVHFVADRPFHLVPDARQAKICFTGSPCGDNGGYVDFSPTPAIFTPEGTPLGGFGLDGTFLGSAGVNILLYVRPVFA